MEGSYSPHRIYRAGRTRGWTKINPFWVSLLWHEHFHIIFSSLSPLSYNIMKPSATNDDVRLLIGQMLPKSHHLTSKPSICLCAMVQISTIIIDTGHKPLLAVSSSVFNEEWSMKSLSMFIITLHLPCCKSLMFIALELKEDSLVLIFQTSGFMALKCLAIFLKLFFSFYVLLWVLSH